jgi:hypothetical protein
MTADIIGLLRRRRDNIARFVTDLEAAFLALA